ncbi:MAG: aminotransferase class I/II-fold pyridoxal phosphate-dependent enzyme [Candidatus Promineifilaceae bacterium]|nr:aminotransferase class I/II-fold pyridoxal phosphate-dependent enzyme [Candidatus Promineifilaceae bacterium]
MLQLTERLEATFQATLAGSVLGSSTRAVHGNVGGRESKANHALITPIVQTATYTFEDTADLRRFMEAKMWGGDPALNQRGEYGRYGNPTVKAVEARLAHLENGEDALLFPSGMAAVTNVLLSMLPAGSHVIYTDDCYRKTRHFCQTFLKRLGISSSEVPMGDYGALERAILPETRVIVSESPTNPYLRVVDLERLVAVAKRHQVKTLIDATFATPVNQQPLDFGVDLVVHSATKYLSGHNDILAGAVIGERGLIHALRQSQGVLGGVLDPHAAHLLERGLKTLGLRVAQQNRTAQAVAEYLQKHPKVERVWYPGLRSHPDHQVARQQLSGFGGVVSFEVAACGDEAPLDTTARFIDAVTIPYIAPSLGGVESLIEQPALMSYYEFSTEERLAIGIKDNLVRFAVGIEDTSDILDDLSQALARV